MNSAVCLVALWNTDNAYHGHRHLLQHAARQSKIATSRNCPNSWGWYSWNNWHGTLLNKISLACRFGQAQKRRVVTNKSRYSKWWLSIHLGVGHYRHRNVSLLAALLLEVANPRVPIGQKRDHNSWFQRRSEKKENIRRLERENQLNWEASWPPRECGASWALDDISS